MRGAEVNGGTRGVGFEVSGVGFEVLVMGFVGRGVGFEATGGVGIWTGVDDRSGVEECCGSSCNGLASCSGEARPSAARGTGAESNSSKLIAPGILVEGPAFE